MAWNRRAKIQHQDIKILTYKHYKKNCHIKDTVVWTCFTHGQQQDSFPSFLPPVFTVLERTLAAPHETFPYLSYLCVCVCVCVYILTYSWFYIHDGTLLHSKSQYTTVKHSRKLLEHTYTSDPHGLGTLIPIEFFQQDLLWQPSNTHSNSCSQEASKHTRSIRRRAIGPLARHNGTSAYSPSLTCTSPDNRMSSSSAV
jgi:hypothetical protein